MRRVLVTVSSTAALGVTALVLAGPALAEDYVTPTTPVKTEVLAKAVSRAPAAVAPQRAVAPAVAVLPASTSRQLAFTGSDAIVGGLALGGALVAGGTGLRVAGRLKRA